MTQEKIQTRERIVHPPAVAAFVQANPRATVNVGGSGVKAAMSATQEAAILLQLYTRTVLGTPDIQLPAAVDKDSGSAVVQDLPKHQATARTNANDYLANVNGKLVAETADIIGFANLWNAQFGSLLALAKNIDQGDNKATFARGVQNLIAQIKVKQGDTLPAAAALTAFLPKVEGDAANFAGDAQNVETALGGESGTIAELKKSLAADQASRGKYIAIIAGGATTDVVGGIMVAVGVFAEIETAGLSTALIAGGLTLLAGGTTAMVAGSIDLGVLDARIAKESRELATDELVYASVQQASHNVTALADATNRGVSAVKSLQAAWQDLEKDLDGVLQQLEIADPAIGAWLQNILLSANADWADALELAKSIQQYGTLPATKETVKS